MKKLLAFLLIITLSVVLVFALSSCDTTEPPTDDENDGGNEETYTVTFDVSGGNEVIPNQTVKSGGKIEKPTDPTRDGYMFDGWYVGEEKWVFAGYNVTEDVTLVAKWINYNITYELDGGVNAENNPATYTVNDEITLSQPTKEGYIFIGWTYEGQDSPQINVTIPKGSTGDRKYTANFDNTFVTSAGVITGVTNYAKKNATELIIPSEIDGVKITGIGDSAFSFCTSLTSVTIGNGVTSIGSSAFLGCTSLTSIEIPNSVTSIGYSAFQSCTSLTGIVIPNSVTNLGYEAFYNCTSLTSVTIGNSVTSIGNKTFYDCTSLTSVTIPNNVKSIDNFAFYNCTSLASVTIGNKVESIGECAFYGCERLMSIVIPNSVTSISYWAFCACTSLTIYCEAEEKPEGWSAYWNELTFSVVWGYKKQ